MHRFALAAALLSFAAQADDSALLQKKAQALVDAVGSGDAKIWAAALDKRFTQIDEAGEISNYDQTVAQVVPLPKGISGTITVTEWKCAFFGDTAVETHLDDEHEDFHGQKLHALYRVTGTWHKEAGEWKLIGMQTIALRQDPPSVTLPEAMTDSYVGRYRAASDYVVEITKHDGKLYAATNGAKAVEIKAELADVLFTPGQPRSRKIVERDGQGRVTGFLSRREERDVVFRREN